MVLEWLIGRYTMPEAVREGESVFEPELVLVLELPSGMLIASTLSSPEEHVSLGAAIESAMQHPLEGLPRRPSRIRVGTDVAARELRIAAAGIPTIVAPVPELDSAFGDFVDMLRTDGPAQSYLGARREIPPAVMQSLFEAARLLFVTAPWKRAWDRQIVRVDIPKLGIEGACISVIGAAGESFGLMLFDSLDDYEAFGEGRARKGDHPVMRSVSFATKEELPPELVREAARHRWAVAGDDAYPVVLCAGADLKPKPVTEPDVRLMTAVTRAFVAFFVEHGEVFELDVPPTPVGTSSEGDGGVIVEISAPYVRRPRRSEAPKGENVHEMDAQLFRDLSRFATKRFGGGWIGADPREEEPESVELVMRFAAWTAQHGVASVAGEYLAARGRKLSADERAWVEAQRAAFLGVWRVRNVEPGSIDVQDLLSGEERVVREHLASQTLHPGDCVLARMIDYRGHSYFAGMHGRPLSFEEAGAVVRDAQRKARRKHLIPIERLRERKLGWFLIDRWTAAAATTTRRGRSA